MSQGYDDWLTTNPRDSEHHSECDVNKEDELPCSCEAIDSEDDSKREKGFWRERIGEWIRKQKEEKDD